MNLCFYFRLLAFRLSNVANKLIDLNLLKAKLGIFVEEQGPQGLRVFGMGIRIMKVEEPLNYSVKVTSYS